MRKLKEADRQKPSASEPKWVALSVSEATDGVAPPIVVKVGTVAVEMRAGSEPAVLSAVVRTLKTLC